MDCWVASFYRGNEYAKIVWQGGVQFVEVIISKLNVRSGPSTYYNTIGYLISGDKANVLDMHEEVTLSEPNIRNIWYKIPYNQIRPIIEPPPANNNYPVIGQMTWLKPALYTLIGFGVIALIFYLKRRKNE